MRLKSVKFVVIIQSSEVRSVIPCPRPYLCKAVRKQKVSNLSLLLLNKQRHIAYFLMQKFRVKGGVMCKSNNAMCSSVVFIALELREEIAEENHSICT